MSIGRDGEGNTALTAAAQGGELETVRQLVAKGEELEQRGASDYTALGLAARGGHVAVLRFLVEQGANVNDRRPNSFTPLMDAATHGRSQSVDILLQAGADLRAESTTGENALTCAVRRRYARLALLLLDRGCPLGSWKGSEDELRDWLEGEIAAGRSRD